MWEQAEWNALWLSLWVASVSVALSLVPAFLLACLLHFNKFRGKIILDFMVLLPIALPPVVAGYALLVLLSPYTWAGYWLGQAGIRLLFTPAAAVLVSTLVGFPWMVRSIRLGLEGIDPRMIAAARTLGAKPADVLWSVILPLSWKAIVSGAMLMFLRSIGEFGATILVAGNIPGRTQTLPLAIYEYALTPDGEMMALRLSLTILAICLAILLVHEWLRQRMSDQENTVKGGKSWISG